MSQEHVKLVHAMFDAWNRGDRDGWMAPAHPEVEWSSAVVRQMEGENTIYKGQADLGRFWDEWHALWNLEIDVVDTRDLGDTVVALAEIRTKGKASGAEIARSVGYVFEFEGERVRRSRAYLSQEEALAAAGVRE